MSEDLLRGVMEPAPSWEEVVNRLPPLVGVPKTEASLVRDLSAALRRTWYPALMSAEAGTHGRSRVDLALVTAAPPRLVGIEAKLSNWERAIRQASLNCYVVDVSLVALPASVIAPAVVRRAHEAGVGILAVSGRDARMVLGATLNDPDPLLRARLLSQLRKVRKRATVREPEVRTEGGRIGA